MQGLIDKTETTDITFIKKLGESLTSEIYLAKKKTAAETVLVKQIRPEFILTGVKEHIEQQRITLRRLNIETVVIPELRFDNDKTLQLIQPAPKGLSLRAWLQQKWLQQNKQVDIATVLELGIALVDCVVLRHQAALIHKAIKPNNILIQEHPIRVELVDEIRVIDDMQLSQLIQNDQYRCETLPYRAPEQTGRIRMNIGYHTDLYSIGAVLYECVMGQPPFMSEDALAIIYSHLAEIPQPVTAYNSSCPPIVAEIISTLLNKEPEQRYHSAKGLRDDLKTCLSFLTSSNTDDSSPIIATFELKQREYSEQIQIPSILVGRDTEQKRLLEEYDRVCAGHLGVVMISGLSGIGKTRLIQELERPIVARRGYYTAGKFNQFTRHLPYSTFSPALVRLIRQFLTEDTKRISYWCDKIQNVVGINGQLLVDLVPELELIIGTQPNILPLPPVETRNRFNDIFSRFLGCLACEQHPLVLFVDDLQWCDQASFDLLELVYTQPHDFPYLMIIGAYRNNEVDENHGVVKMENAIKDSSQPLMVIHLEALDHQAVNQMVAFILNTAEQKAEPLTDIIYAVSVGNPLYINESLYWLHKNRRISLSEDGVWSWDSEQLVDLRLPDSAKALFCEKIALFPKEVIDLLSTAAILGSQFEAEDLAKVANISIEILYSMLNEVLAQRLLQHDKTSLRFFHDQIQAAAADFFDDGQQKQCHENIARVYIDQLSEGGNEVESRGETDHSTATTARLFSIVEHLAAARLDNASDGALFEEAQFTYRAGIAAMNALALEASDHYLTQSAELCIDSRWDTDYDFMFELYQKLARAAVMRGSQERSNKVVDIALQYARSDLDRAECLYEQTVAAASQGDLVGSIELARRALILIGRPIPETEDEIQTETALFIESFHGHNRDIWQEVIDAPDIVGRQEILALHLASEVLTSAYVTGQLSMFTLMACRTVDIAVKTGVDDSTCFGLSIMAFYFRLMEDNPRKIAYEESMLAMAERFPDSFGTVRGLLAGVSLTLHSKYSIPDVLDLCQKARDLSKKCGEISFVGNAGFIILWYEFTRCSRLSHIHSETKAIIEYGQQFNLAITIDVGDALQLSLAPLGGGGRTSADTSAVTDTIARWKRDEQVVALSVYFTFSGMVAYYNHQVSEAKHFLDEGEAFIMGTMNTIVYHLWFVFRYLIALDEDEGEVTGGYFDKVAGWATHGPILKPYLALMQAESVAKGGDLRQIRIAYQDAIDISHKEEYVFLEAFLNERLSLYLKKENHHTSEIYLNSAIVLYQRCGAVNKIVQLKGREYTGIATEEPQHKLIGDQKWTDDQKLKQELDVNYLVDAVQAIAGELDFDKLLSTIVTSIMARLGAKTGYLLIVEGGVLVPNIVGLKTEEVSVLFKDDPQFSIDKLSMGIARYVFNAKEKLILDNAFEFGDFVADDTVQKEALRSVFCLPIIKQTEVLGVLYLENSLLKSVFTPEQIEMANLLTAQAAIALENTALMDELKAAERETQAHKLQLQAVLDGVKIFAGLLSVDGRLLFANATALSRTNVELDDILDKPLEKTYWFSRSPFLQQQIQEDVQRAREGAEIQRELTIRLGEDIYATIDFTLQPIFDSEGKVVFLVPSGVDITDRLENEKNLIMSNEKMESLVKERTQELQQKQFELTHASRLASLGELATGIAHELGQPLQIIKTAAGIIRDEIANETFNQSEVIPIARDISEQVDKAAIIINNMRTYARYDDAKKAEAIDISIPFRECLVFFQEQFYQHQIAFSLDIAEHLPLVRVNPQKLQQIAVNLLSNARSAVEIKMLEEDSLYSREIKVKIVTESSNSSSSDRSRLDNRSSLQNYVVLTVEDNGVGMSDEIRQRCLEPFFTTKGPREGTGLGLSIIYRIMDEFGFELEISSKLGKGSVFKVSMPEASVNEVLEV